MADHYDLSRFIEAQAATYDTALAELRRGSKKTHWMWFIFPQLDGLGHSEMARTYAIRSFGEAQNYLVHDLLGARLSESIAALQDVLPTTAEEVFGGIDAKKLRSSLTLFIAAGGGPLFVAALERWFGGEPDEQTQRLLGLA